MSNKIRDDFKPKVKRILAERAGYHCSNPSCRALTYGPTKQNVGSVNMGVAAHISSAAPKGRRFDETLSAFERSGYDNGIWLCYYCSVIIDKNEEDYPKYLLYEWKQHSEEAARKGLESPGLFALGEVNASTVGFVHRYKKPSQYFIYRNAPTPAGYSYRETITFNFLGEQEPKTVINPSIPINLSLTLGPTPKSCVFILSLQNLGTGVEPTASISINFMGAQIWKIEMSNQDRVTILNPITKAGTKTGKTGFTVSKLMPNEELAMTVYSLSAGPFNTEMFSESTGRKSIPIVSDVVFGKPKLVKSSPDDKEFKKKHYPFE